MNPPNQPGQRCRVIGGRMPFNGEGRSPNMGAEVLTVFLHDEQAGIEQENVWRCQSVNGQMLKTYYGAGQTADFLECWLEVIPTPPAKQVTDETTKEIHE